MHDVQSPFLTSSTPARPGPLGLVDATPETSPENTELEVPEMDLGYEDAEYENLADQDVDDEGEDAEYENLEDEDDPEYEDALLEAEADRWSAELLTQDHIRGRETTGSNSGATAEPHLGEETSHELELGAEAEALLGDLWGSARGLWEKALVVAALAKGERDASALTNLVFFRRHPERGGRALSPTEPGFSDLAREWTDIRDTLVQPALSSAAAIAARGSLTSAARTATGRLTGGGTSRVARAASRQWTGPARPAPWRAAAHGLVVHQTGGKLPCEAQAKGQDPLEQAVAYYTKTRGTHYVCGWAGLAGELVQVAASDLHRAPRGVGMRKQADSVARGTWQSDLSPAAVAQWHARWSGVSDPTALLPGTRSANSAYVHVEMIPAVVPWCESGKGLPGDVPPPMRPGLRYTQAQHEAIAGLAVDIARRHGWPDAWWDTNRLLGHEDLSPISRHDKRGGWDPGGMRAHPWFDWVHVKSAIRSQW